MTDNDDLMPVPDPDRLDHLVDRIDVNSEAMDNLRDETKVENVKRDKRIKWSRIVSIVAIAVGVIGIAVGGVGIKVALSAQDSADAIVSVRTQSRTATCSGFEAFANALIGLSTPAPDDAARQAQQTRIDAFHHDLETRLAALNCHLNLLPAR